MEVLLIKLFLQWNWFLRLGADDAGDVIEMVRSYETKMSALTVSYGSSDIQDHICELRPTA
jgi:hypothetical protein